MGAIFSDDRKYRYMLSRTWGAEPMVMYIGLNPSTANESKNDNTIRRLIEISKYNGFGGFYMLNLFAYVSTDPKQLVYDENLSINDKYLLEYAAKSATVVFAWGAFKQARERGKQVMNLFPQQTYCLHQNNDGSPKHPLFCKDKSLIIKLFKELPTR